MEDQLISFELAKLANAKGFEFCVVWNYILEAKSCGENFERLLSTQSLLQRWLREIHKIDVNVLPYNEDRKKEYEVCVNKAVTTWSGYNTYEEALEAGLIEALKLI